ncbi:MAG TPA: tRNA (guanosine(37)-N1)-methyltransferase TrmD [Candidatus Babeliales bacterium]|nr:tRNA (guanosine(37)-N1)-methyltransferase TrmD [Candidatus Babeliales bacterium]
MNISLVTLFPQLYTPFLDASLIGRARQSGMISTDLVNLLDLTEPKKRIDSPTVGPGTGMLIKPEIMQKAIESQQKKHGKAYRIFFSPQGRKIDQQLLKELASVIQQEKHLMLVASRYEGIDTRVEEEYADIVLSLGDFVLMGGDIPAMAFLEGILRYMPGIVGKSESVEKDSFTGPWVDYPEYTLPVDWQGRKIPEIVQSGNHAAIEEWRSDHAAKKTVVNHFQWLRSWALNNEQKELAARHMPPHYMVLMHDQMKLKDGRVGTTSVTTMDIHDIARSSRTYGIKNFFISTPLTDQRTIVQTLLDFWQSKEGIHYNSHRHQAISRVALTESFEDTIKRIEEKEGKRPIVIATSAQQHELPVLSYSDQQKVWEQSRPVLILLGTAYGMSDAILEQCDYMLAPIEGFTDFNHLAVRSAAGIILDRWLGINPRYFQLAKE